MGGRGDPCVVEFEPVVYVAAFGLGGEAGAVEGSIEEVAGTVASEHASCTIGAMRSGREAQDEQAGFGIAE